MKRFVFSTIASLCITISINSYSQGEWEWAHHIKSITSHNAEINDIKQHNNYIYYYGSFLGTISIGGNDYPSNGGRDILLIKSSLDGTLQWVRTAGSIGNEIASQVSIDENGYIYIAGGFQRTCNFDGIEIVGTADNRFDPFIAKYNPNGNIVWAKRVGWGNEHDRITGLAVSPEGIIYVSGLFINGFTIGDDDNTNSYDVGTDPRWKFAASFDSNGSFLWSNAYRTTSAQTEFRAVSITDDNSVYIGGGFGGSIFIDGTEYESAGSGDIIIIKLDENGNTQWVRTGGSTSDDQLNSIYAYQNDVYIIGYVQGTGTIDSTATLQSSQYTASGVDIIAARYNSEGRLIWKNVIGGSGSHSGYGIQIHENIMVCSGFFSNSITFNETTITSGGSTDAGFFVFDLEGNPITAGSVSGSLEDRGQGVIYDGQGNTYIAGYFKSAELVVGDLDPLENTSSPLMDGFIAKYQNPFSATFTTKKNVTCNGGSDGELTVTTYFGTGPYTYVWTKDDVPVEELTTAIATNLEPGTYKVTVTDSSDPVKTATTILYTITQPPVITAGTPDIINVTCPGGEDGAIDIHPSGGTGSLSFFWTSDDGFGLVATDEDQTGLIKGTYSLLITDANGCEFIDSYTITEPSAIAIAGTVTNITNPGSNGGIEITSVTGGTVASDYTYSWVGPSSFTSTDKNISGLNEGGIYTITVNDDDSCQQEEEFSVIDDRIFSIWISAKTNVLCYGLATGTATVSYNSLGGDNPTISWKNASNEEVGTSATVADLPAGTYTVEVTQDPLEGSETLQKSVTITQPTAIVGSITATHVTCFGGTNGSAVLDVSGGKLPYSYLWKKDEVQVATSKDIAGRTAGSYTAFVTDANGCEPSFLTTINQPDDIAVTIDATDVTCYGGNNGELDITGNISGGTAPYTQLWSNTLTALKISNLTAGNYSVTVTDSKGCQKSKSETVSQPTQITATFSTTATTCPGGNDGKINVTGSSGGTGSHYYSINGTDYFSSNEFTGVNAGNNTVWVKDDADCVRTFVVNVDQPTPFSATPTYTLSTCPESNDGSITLVTDGGLAPRTYLWTGPSIQGSPPQARDQYNLLPGEYTVQIEDALECKSEIFSFELSSANPTPSTSDIVGNTSPSCREAGVSYSVTLTAGSTYAWTVPADATIVSGATGPDNNQITVDFWETDGNITVTETSAAGCVGVAKTLSVALSGCGLDADFTASTQTACVGSEVTFTDISTGVFETTTYLWDFGDGANPATSAEKIPPVVTYSTSGNKTVSLVITEGGSDTETKTDFITVFAPSVGGSVSGGSSICSGSTSELLTLSGYTGDVVKWESSTDGSNWTAINHAGTTYTSGALTQTTSFRAVVKSGVCDEQESDYTTVIVDPPTVGGSLSGGASICEGDASPELSLSEYVGSIVRWESSTDGSNWNSIAHTTSSYTPGILTASTQYRAVVQSGVCDKQTSLSTTITVNPLPTLTVSDDFAICASEDATLTATGNADTYVWDNGVSNGVAFTPTENKTFTVTGTITATGCQSTDQVTVTVNPLPTVTAPADKDICEGTTISLTASGTADIYEWDNGVLDGANFTPTETKTYTVTGTINATGCSSTDQVEVVISPQTVAGAVSGGETICSGSTSGVLTLSGYTGEITRWQYSTNGTIWVTINHTNEKYQSGILTQSTQFRARVKSGTCPERISSSTLVSVDMPTVGGKVIGGTAICDGEASPELQLTDHTGSVIKWQSSTDDGTSWTDINNTEETYTGGPLSLSTLFRAIVQNGVCEEKASEATIVTVNPIPDPIITNVSSLSVCSSDPISVELIVNIQDAESYQWLLDGDPIEGATDPNYISTEAGSYSAEVIVKGCFGLSNELSIVTINNPVPLISTNDDLIYCEGEPINVEFTVDILGADSYQWLIDGVAVDNANASTYTAETAGSYSVEVVVNGCSGVSNEFTVVILDNPSPTISPNADLTYCEGQDIDVLFTVDILNADAYQWLLDGVPIENAVGDSFAASLPGSYSVEVTVNGCAGTSSEKEIEVFDNPNPTISSESTLRYCEGQQIKTLFLVDITDADAYQWLLNGTPIEDAVESTYEAIEAGIYSVEAVINGCSGISNELVVEENPNPNPEITTDDNLSFCEGETIKVVLTVDVDNADNYRWFKDSEIIEDAIVSTYTATKLGAYSVEVTVNGCTGLSNEIEVMLIGELMPIITNIDPLVWCSDDDIKVTLTVDIMDADTYQWYLNDEPIDGEEASSLLATQPGKYAVHITKGACSGVSNPIEVVVIPNPKPFINTDNPISLCTGTDISVLFEVDVLDAEDYQWFKDDSPIVGANGSTYEASEVGTYKVEVVKNGCSGTSNSLTIVQDDELHPTISTPDKLMYCDGDDVQTTFAVDIANADAYQWKLDGIDIANAVQSTFTATQAGSYTVLVTVGVCSGISDAMVVVVSTIPEPVISTNDKLIWGEDETISVLFTSNITNADSYQWLQNDATIPDAFTNSYVASEAGIYSLIVSVDNCTGTSNKLEVRVSSTPYYTITFTVKNSSGIEVENAQIVVQSHNPIYTNVNGQATIQLEDGAYNFVVTAETYDEYNNTFGVDGNDLQVQVNLVAVGIVTDEFILTSTYPNPFSSEIRISNPDVVNRVIISNIVGQKIMEVKIDGADRINTQTLPYGIYLVRLISHDNRTAIFKMVKER